MNSKHFTERPFEEVEGGCYDDYDFYYTPNGSFWDADGIYFNKEGYDKHGGYYDDNFNYIPGKNWIQELLCYDDEVEDDDYPYHDYGDEEEEIFEDRGEEQDGLDGNYNCELEDEEYNQVFSEQIIKREGNPETEKELKLDPELENFLEGLKINDKPDKIVEFIPATKNTREIIIEKNKADKSDAEIIRNTDKGGNNSRGNNKELNHKKNSTNDQHSKNRSNNPHHSQTNQPSNSQSKKFKTYNNFDNI